MMHLEIELKKIKEIILEMMQLAKIQLEKSKIALLEYDSDIAKDIIRSEKRINAIELSIDREIENVLALHKPVARDLRFTIAMLKINSDIERIADYADGIADYVIDMEEAIPKKALELTHLSEMFDIAISMMSDIQEAFRKGNTDLARQVYKKDEDLNLINSSASKVITQLIDGDTQHTRSMLYLFSVIRKIERTGDHIKNIAEDIIFHHEAEVLKHTKTL
jgi:phosphate transport system protein